MADGFGVCVELAHSRLGRFPQGSDLFPCALKVLCSLLPRLGDGCFRLGL
jgi:hypothetical protein